MNRYQGILLLTDLDGTLLRHDKTVSAVDLDAIAYFKAHGGCFSVVSGRAPMGMLHTLELLDPNTLVGCFNGGGIYDPVARKTLHAVTVPHEVLAFAEYAALQFPEVGVEVFTPNRVLFCKQNDYTEKHRTDEALPLVPARLCDIDEPITKLLFAGETQHIRRLAEAFSTVPDSKNFNFMQSDPNYYEILPQGIDKSRTVRYICKHTGIDLSHTVTVGDNDNDAPMLAITGRSYAVANATPAAKAAARCVLEQTNLQDPLSRVIELL